MLKNIGNTPMIKITYKNGEKINHIYTKLESYNPTGSIKDRVAFYIIDKAKERGALKDNMPIIEATSGNTGISIAALGAYYKHPVYIFMPDWVSKERVKLMKNYGANVILVSREEGGFKKCLEEAQKLSKEKNGFLSNQFANTDNLLAHYETTGNEIINQLPEKVSVEEFQSLLTGKDVEKILKNQRIQYAVINQNLDEYLIEHNAQKVALFTDFDPISAIKNLSRNAELYWFCFEQGRNKPIDFKGKFYKIYDLESLVLALKNIDKPNMNRDDEEELWR